MIPTSLVDNPRLEEWLRIQPDNGVHLLTGKVELGQGILTALMQIAAEELELPLEMVRVTSGHTDLSPNESYTSGSQSIEVSGSAVRLVCADAMRLLEEAAAQRLGTTSVRPLRDGRFAGETDQTVGYAELAEGIDWSQTVLLSAQPKSPREYRLVGRRVPRVDLPTTITGAGFIHDLTIPEMAHGRILRPPAVNAELEEFDRERIRACAGVIAVVRDGRFIGVCAEREEQALEAIRVANAACRWHVEQGGPGPQSARELVSESSPTVLRSEQVAGSAEAMSPESVTLRATYTKPFIAHASIGPSCAIAQLADGQLTVWSHSQGVFALRAQLASIFAMLESAVTVIHTPGAGCYGHNGADDVALDAALLARAIPGRAVRVVWSREDELAWSPVGSAMRVEMAASLDSTMRVAGWSLDVTSGTHAGRPGDGSGINLLAARHLNEPIPVSELPDVPPTPDQGGARNAVALYEFPNHRVRYKFIPALPIRTSSLRSLGAFANVFAIESFMDELAAFANQHPVEFRLRHLSDKRASDAVKAAAEMANWSACWEPPGEHSGIGMGFAQYKNAAAYCAVVAEVDVVNELRVRHVYCAIDAGLVINPDGLENQVEGGIIQAISWAVKEEVLFDHRGITSRDWEAYRILGFSEVPEIDVQLLNHPDERSLGVGEAVHGPTAAAVGNALANALGVRVRDMPLTRDAIVAAMD